MHAFERDFRLCSHLLDVSYPTLFNFEEKDMAEIREIGERVQFVRRKLDELRGFL